MLEPRREQADRLNIVLCFVAEDLRVRRGPRVPEAARTLPSRYLSGRCPVWSESAFVCSF